MLFNLNDFLCDPFTHFLVLLLAALSPKRSCRIQVFYIKQSPPSQYPQQEHFPDPYLSFSYMCLTTLQWFILCLFNTSAYKYDSVQGLAMWFNEFSGNNDICNRDRKLLFSPMKQECKVLDPGGNTFKVILRKGTNITCDLVIRMLLQVVLKTQLAWNKC